MKMIFCKDMHRKTYAAKDILPVTRNGRNINYSNLIYENIWSPCRLINRSGRMIVLISYNAALVLRRIICDAQKKYLYVRSYYTLNYRSAIHIRLRPRDHEVMNLIPTDKTTLFHEEHKLLQY